MRENAQVGLAPTTDNGPGLAPGLFFWKQYSVSGASAWLN
jgi:hypothetical protein